MTTVFRRCYMCLATFVSLLYARGLHKITVMPPIQPCSPRRALGPSVTAGSVGLDFCRRAGNAGRRAAMPDGQNFRRRPRLCGDHAS